MATAVDPVRAEPITFPVVSTPPIPIRAHRRYHWTKWALAIGLIIALAVVGELWRMHSQNAITYETVPLERGTVQASVTATGTLNAVVDVQVGSQVSGNIKALYADFNTKVTKGQLVALIDPELFQTQVDQAKQHWARPSPRFSPRARKFRKRPQIFRGRSRVKRVRSL